MLSISEKEHLKKGISEIREVIQKMRAHKVSVRTDYAFGRVVAAMENERLDLESELIDL